VPRGGGLKLRVGISRRGRREYLIHDERRKLGKGCNENWGSDGLPRICSEIEFRSTATQQHLDDSIQRFVFRCTYQIGKLMKPHVSAR
jgi:hypothetical protein